MTTNLIHMPLIPLRGLIIFPGMVIHLDVGREKSIQSLEKAMMLDQHIFLAAQKDSALDDPAPEDIHPYGAVAKVNQMLKLPNGTVRILIEGIYRAELNHFIEQENHFLVEIERLEDIHTNIAEEVALMRALLEQFEHYTKISKKVTKETLASVSDMEEPSQFADIVASHITLKMSDKQKVLETLEVKAKLQLLLDIISNEKEVLELERKIGQRVKKSMEDTQKEYYLREQMKAIQKELGDKDGKTGEIADLRKKMAEKELPERVVEVVDKELSRYERVPQSSAESSVIRNYIDWILALPWIEQTTDNLDLAHAEHILNEDHYGLDKVKERVLEYLAVKQLTNSLKGPILCLVGPPGVGKTSLARSVAKAVDRHFVRASLGGVRDEAEIRGHRRTYIGAMPGRIIQGMRKAETINPVFLLDEIDKMSNDFRGDPSSAMLEVLDPEQNHNYSDHYLEETYDLSKVMFIATANNLATVPRPLLDRMEVITIPGYTEIEKLFIAKQHLLPKQLQENGLKKSQLQIRDQALLKLIRLYTREAGVRGLERQLSSLCRKSAKVIVSGAKTRVVVTEKQLEELLGKPLFRYGMMELNDQIGAATGLAYTAAGGDILSIEVSLAKGKGKLTLTGKLGDVMKESAQAALSYIRSRADTLKIDPDFLEKNDIHIHVPEGATPKDGPSAGITMATALVSALTGRPVRKEVGMTGEITLRGRVLPIGGLKEKSLSAHRAGITTIIIPADNQKDLEDIPDSVKETITFIPVDHLDTVLKYALLEEKHESQ